MLALRFRPKAPEGRNTLALSNLCGSRFHDANDSQISSNAGQFVRSRSSSFLASPRPLIEPHAKFDSGDAPGPLFYVYPAWWTEVYPGWCTYREAMPGQYREARPGQDQGHRARPRPGTPSQDQGHRARSGFRDTEPGQGSGTPSQGSGTPSQGSRSPRPSQGSRSPRPSQD